MHAVVSGSAPKLRPARAYGRLTLVGELPPFFQCAGRGLLRACWSMHCCVAVAVWPRYVEFGGCPRSCSPNDRLLQNLRSLAIAKPVAQRPTALLTAPVSLTCV